MLLNKEVMLNIALLFLYLMNPKWLPVDVQANGMLFNVKICQFDGPTTIGHKAIFSVTKVGFCHDTGVYVPLNYKGMIVMQTTSEPGIAWIAVPSKENVDGR
jgi:hypothetical protein